MAHHCLTPAGFDNSLPLSEVATNLKTRAVSTATARVISTPELLDIILSHLCREELPPMALVSRVWLEIARDHIWGNVRNAHELFGLLAPVEGTADFGYLFKRVPTHDDWANFRPWASRVRCITIRGPTFVDNISSLLSKMAYTKFWHPLLPNLRTLKWFQEDQMEQLGLFLHSGLDRLVMCMPSANVKSYSAEAIYSDIASRAPSLREMVFFPMEGLSVEPVAVPVAKLLLRLQSSLQLLNLPVYGLTQPIFEAASQAHGLRELTFIWADYPVVARYHDVLVFAPRLEPNSFSALRDLCVSAPLSDLTKLLTNSNFPSNQLAEFHVRTVRPETPASVTSFHKTIARKCASLVSFYNMLSAPCGDDDNVIELWPVAPAPDTALGWDALAPLTALKTLNAILIAHDHALNISAKQLADFARCLPALKELCLSPSPNDVGDQPPLMKLAELGVLIDAMPSMETLELYVDATGDSAAYTQWVEKPFARLESLWLSASPVNMDGRTRISLFLASIMPVTARISTDKCQLWDYVAPAARHVDEWDKIAEDVELWLKLLEARGETDKADHS